MSRLAILVAALALAGCTKTVTVERPVPVEVAVPVPSPCVPRNLSAPPLYPDDDETLRNASPAERYLLIAAGRALRIARLRELEPVVASCPRVR